MYRGVRSSMPKSETLQVLLFLGILLLLAIHNIQLRLSRRTGIESDVAVRDQQDLQQRLGTNGNTGYSSSAATGGGLFSTANRGSSAEALFKSTTEASARQSLPILISVPFAVTNPTAPSLSSGVSIEEWFVSLISLLTYEPKVSLDILLHSPDHLNKTLELLLTLDALPSVRIIDAWHSGKILRRGENKEDSDLSSWRFIRQRRAFGVSVIEFSSLLIEEGDKYNATMRYNPNVFIDTNGAMDRREKNHVFYPLTPSEAVARMEYLCKRRAYSSIIIRGEKLASLAIRSPTIGPLTWVYAGRVIQNSGIYSHFETLVKAVDEANARIIFETLVDKIKFESMLQENGDYNKTAPIVVDGSHPGDNSTASKRQMKYVITPPLLLEESPKLKAKQSPLSYKEPKPLRLCHVGGLTSGYKLLELVDVFLELSDSPQLLRQNISKLELLFIETRDFASSQIGAGSSDDEEEETEHRHDLLGFNFDSDERDGHSYRRRLLDKIQDIQSIRVYENMQFSKALSSLSSECSVGIQWFVENHLTGPPRMDRARYAISYYVLTGIPVLLPPTPENQRMLGVYPYYIDNTIDSIRDAILFVFSLKSMNRYLYYHASRRLIAAASSYTTDFAFTRWIRPVLRREPARQAPPQAILFSGHDFSRMPEVIDYYQSKPDIYEVRIDHWSGPETNNEKRTQIFANWATIVWAEGCYGNTLYWAKTIRSDLHQRLFVRYQWMEIFKKYHSKIIWNNVDHLIFASKHIRDSAAPALPIDSSYTRVHVLPNPVDFDAFDRPKHPDALRRIGLLGYVPNRKNPDLAVQILKEILKRDPSGGWTLHLAGVSPEEYAAMPNHAPKQLKELDSEYYAQLNQSLQLPPLKGRVFFDEFTQDQADWFTKIGFILSTSTEEGSHHAVAEGIASGSVAIVKRWTGATVHYSQVALFYDTAKEAAQLILDNSEPYTYESLQRRMREEARRMFDLPVFTSRVEDFITGRRKVIPKRIIY